MGSRSGWCEVVSGGYNQNRAIRRDERMPLEYILPGVRRRTSFNCLTWNVCERSLRIRTFVEGIPCVGFIGRPQTLLLTG